VSRCVAVLLRPVVVVLGVLPPSHEPLSPSGHQYMVVEVWVGMQVEAATELCYSPVHVVEPFGRGYLLLLCPAALCSVQVAAGL
jgi:hypothetical protein